MKQFCTLFFSFLINTIVLIHVLVPHHHHGDLPCFKWDIEQDCCSHQHDDENHHDCSSHQHSHDCNCLLDQVLLLNHQEEKQENQCDVCLQNHTNHLIQAILLSFNYDFYLPEGKKIENPPYFITYHSIDASRISGLRAPPVA